MGTSMTRKIKDFLREHPYFSDILNRLSDAVYICDTEGKLIFINTAAEKLDGYLLKDIYERPTQELYGLDETNSPMLKALKSEKPVIDSVFRYYINGKEIIQLCNAAPLHYEGKIIGAYTVQRDVTKIKDIIERNISLQQKLFDGQDKIGEKSMGLEENFSMLLGEDPKFQDCKRMALLAAQNDSSVMITAETGCGKEMFAKCIHNSSNRKDGPFLALNCAAIPENLLESLLFGTAKGAFTGAVEREGLFEQAQGGTLFLDEINSMPLASQSKLLRVLEEKTVQHLGSKERIKVDVRIISSSNVLPKEAIDKKLIRADLFYRLAVVNIIVPPLAQRQGDVFILANHFISVYNERFHKHIMGLDDEVLSFFLNFNWPGNVRQLKHCIESAMNFVTDEDYTIKKHHLPPYLLREEDEHFSGYRQKINRETISISETPLKQESTIHLPINLQDNQGENPEDTELHIFDSIRENEKERIIQALIECNGNVSKTAKSLGMGRQSLIYRLKKYNIK